MRTRDWLDTRVERARQRIIADCERGEPDIGTLLAAFEEITDGSPSESDAMLLAEALSCLPADDCARLLMRARDSVIQQAKEGADRALSQLPKPSRQGEKPQTVEFFRATPGTSSSYPARPAMALQALIWAVLPPAKSQPWIVY